VLPEAARTRIDPVSSTPQMKAGPTALPYVSSAFRDTAYLHAGPELCTAVALTLH
jgi:hypothetical protein